ncbi:MAG: PilZ domain-containing protein [Sphingopyxis sp.]
MTMSWPLDANEDAVSLRGKARDSLYVKAHITVDRLQHGFDIVVRNVSAGGLLADTTMDLELGDVVKIELRRVGVVPGRVVWIKPARFGVAFDVIIDPQLVRQPVTVKKSSGAAHNPSNQIGPGKRVLRL